MSAIHHSAVVVGLGAVDPDIVRPILGADIRFVPEPTAADLASADGAIVRAAFRLSRDVLDRMPRLRVIARTGVGVDLVDTVAARERGIPVVITPGSNTHAVAEGAFAHLLHLVKRLQPLTTIVRTGRWEDRAAFPVGDLEGATIGIVGYGRIGRRVGELATCFGMTVLAYDPVARPEASVAADSLVGLLERSDVISLHVPLTEETRHLIDAKALKHCRPGAILINCSRGALVDLDAALTALESGELGGVGLDVFESEPPEHHALFDHPNVVLTPHVMGLSSRAMRATLVDAAQGVVDVLAGRAPAAIAPVQDGGIADRTS